jgi:DNA replicative helicase MCM subunit Mcm2 (Cdc46/Mcm family)
MAPACPLGICGSHADAACRIPDAGRRSAVAADTVGVALVMVLGLTGAVLAILLLMGKFRFACPVCRQRHTQVVGSSSGGTMDLLCEQCGIFRETGPFKLKLKREPFTDVHGNPLVPPSS